MAPRQLVSGHPLAQELVKLAMAHPLELAFQSEMMVLVWRQSFPQIPRQTDPSDFVALVAERPLALEPPARAQARLVLEMRTLPVPSPQSPQFPRFLGVVVQNEIEVLEAS